MALVDGARLNNSGIIATTCRDVSPRAVKPAVDLLILLPIRLLITGTTAILFLIAASSAPILLVVAALLVMAAWQASFPPAPEVQFQRYQRFGFTGGDQPRVYRIIP